MFRHDKVSLPGSGSVPFEFIGKYPLPGIETKEKKKNSLNESSFIYLL